MEDTSESTTLLKLFINSKVLYIKTVWEPNNEDMFHIKIYDGNISWSGSFSHDSASHYREDESEIEYKNNIKEVLSNEDDNFGYGFTVESNNRAKFVWKKKYIDSSLPDAKPAFMIIGSVHVQRDEDAESKECLIDLLLKENKDLKKSVQSLNNQKNTLKIELDKCKEDLEKFVDVKVNLESDLYNKFSQVLSAKKRRIKLLEEQLSDK